MGGNEGGGRSGVRGCGRRGYDVGWTGIRIRERRKVGEGVIEGDDDVMDY